MKVYEKILDHLPLKQKVKIMLEDIDDNQVLFDKIELQSHNIESFIEKYKNDTEIQNLFHQSVPTLTSGVTPVPQLIEIWNKEWGLSTNNKKNEGAYEGSVYLFYKMAGYDIKKSENNKADFEINDITVDVKAYETTNTIELGRIGSLNIFKALKEYITTYYISNENIKNAYKNLIINQGQIWFSNFLSLFEYTLNDEIREQSLVFYNKRIKELDELKSINELSEYESNWVDDAIKFYENRLDIIQNKDNNTNINLLIKELYNGEEKFQDKYYYFKKIVSAKFKEKWGDKAENEIAFLNCNENGGEFKTINVDRDIINMGLKRDSLIYNPTHTKEI